jgi:hypothetical protein
MCDWYGILLLSAELKTAKQYFQLKQLCEDYFVVLSYKKGHDSA